MEMAKKPQKGDWKTNMLPTDDSGRIIVSSEEQIARAITNHEKRLNHLERLENPTAGSCSVWNPLCPPASANVNDDEFTTDLAAWTTWNPGALAHVLSIEDWGFQMYQPTQGGGDIWSGMFKLAPTFPCSIWSRIDVNGGYGNFLHAGLILGQDLTANPGTSDFVSIEYRSDATYSYFISVQKWNQYNAWAGITYLSYTISNVRGIGSAHYVRLRMASATACAVDMSKDGILFHPLGSFTVPFTTAEVGYAMNNRGTGVDAQMVSPFFRVGALGDLFSVPEGARS